MRTSYNQIAGTGLERMAALSDGLFAIAMTLIVLEIRVPVREAVHTEKALGLALVALVPRMVTYLLSFLTLGIFWVGQQTQLNHLGRADRHLSWLHLAFLAAGAVLYATWAYAERAGLVKEGTPRDAGGAIRRRIVVAQTLYAAGAALCVVDTYWSIGFIVLVQLNYAVAPRIPGLSRLTA